MYGINVVGTPFIGFINGFATPSGGGNGNGNGNGGGNVGDMTKSEYDSNFNGVVDEAENAVTVNSKQVNLDVLNVPISPLEASDDWDSI